MTRMNILAGTTIVPLLARLVLAAAFITAGWNKLMHVQEFQGTDADALIERGVADIIQSVPQNSQPTAAVRFFAGAQATDEAQHDQTDSAEEAPAPQNDPQAGGERDLAGNGNWDVPEPPADVIEEDPVSGDRVLVGKRMHGVTLMLIERGWQGRTPIWLAWLLTFTELVGGALLLIGLFTRIWAAAIAVAIGVAFCFTSATALVELGGPFGVAADMAGGYAAFHTMYAQLGLCVLALGVLLTGPGPVSLDRLIFRRRNEDEDYHEDFVARRTGPD